MDLEEMEFLHILRRATERGRKLKFPKYEKNLRYDLDGIYSYGTQIAELNMLDRTIHSLGKWSHTSTKHYNYAKHLLQDSYNFREI
jgi:hypothetical protein